VRLCILITSFLGRTHHYRGEYERAVGLATDNLAALPAYAKGSSLAGKRIGVVSAAALVVLVLVTLAHGESLRPLEATPDRLTWVRDPRGYEQALIVGDPEKSGLYAAHIRFPAGLRIAPHFHPDERIVTVLSGTVYFGYGERFDETRMRALPAGSVWTEPARQPHFAWAKEGEVVVQVIGIGPSGTTPVPPGQ